MEVCWKIAVLKWQLMYTELVEKLMVKDLICQELADLSKRFIESIKPGSHVLWQSSMINLFQ